MKADIKQWVRFMLDLRDLAELCGHPVADDDCLLWGPIVTSGRTVAWVLERPRVPVYSKSDWCVFFHWQPYLSAERYGLLDRDRGDGSHGINAKEEADPTAALAITLNALRARCE